MNEKEQKQIQNLEKAIQDIKEGKLVDWIFVGASEENGAKLITSSRALPQLVMSTYLERNTKKILGKQGIPYEVVHDLTKRLVESED